MSGKQCMQQHKRRNLDVHVECLCFVLKGSTILWHAHMWVALSTFDAIQLASFPSLVCKEKGSSLRSLIYEQLQFIIKKCALLCLQILPCRLSTLPFL
jgi:hypothetical protein